MRLSPHTRPYLCCVLFSKFYNESSVSFPGLKSHWNIPTLETNKNKNKKQKKKKSNIQTHVYILAIHHLKRDNDRSVEKNLSNFTEIFSEKSFLSKQMYFLVSSFKTILTGQRSQHNWIHFQEKNLIIFFLCRWVLWEMGILGYLENSCLKKMDLIKIIVKVCQSDERI
jgi:hypothetical protein